MSGAPPFPHRMLVGTFHKTGTVLMAAILRDVAAEFGLSLWKPRGPAAEDPPPAWDLCFHAHSRWPPELLRSVPHRGAIVIRDPRDVVISGAYYHATATEPWLHRPREALGGRTYAEAINALPDMQSRFRFEMEHAGRHTIRSMLRAVSAYPGFLVLRYESLAADEILAAFRSLFAHLGFGGEALERCLAIARRHSLFAGAKRRSRHVRNGAPEQWRSEFTPDTLAAFNALHPGTVERLGYPPN